MRATLVSFSTNSLGSKVTNSDLSNSGSMHSGRPSRIAVILSRKTDRSSSMNARRRVVSQLRVIQMTQQRQKKHSSRREEPTRPTRSSTMTSKSLTLKEITSSMSMRRKVYGISRTAMEIRSVTTLWSSSSLTIKVRMSSRSLMATKSSTTKSSTCKNGPIFVLAVARQRSSRSFRRYPHSTDFSSRMQSSVTVTTTSSFSASRATIKPYATKIISKYYSLKVLA